MRNVKWLAAILLSVWVILVPVVLAMAASDPAETGRTPVRVYTSDSDGLPQNTVPALHVDRRGYLWAGTDHGAAV